MIRALPSGFCVALFAFALSAGAPLCAASAESPVVVELYTSQGCSSCPPADALLTDLADESGVLALSFHVDYWDYIGWRDPFGSPMNTQRQRGYAQTLRLDFVYTPQMVVDGRYDVVGSRVSAVRGAIEKAGKQGKPLTLEFVSGDGGKVVVPAGAAPAEGAAIWRVTYDKSHATEVLRGENSGRELVNVNVVRAFERLGTWTGERLELPLMLAEAHARGRGGCAIIVQEGRQGPVLGAIDLSLPMASD
ncbi:MAG: DUF1223 domain-containing protein [Kiloniellales bacterium]